jgi:hypothetical protein
MSNRAKAQVAIVSTSTDSLARALAWFGIGLGAVQVLAPGSVARVLGIAGRRGRIAGSGARELATGAGILLAERRRGWLWGRVAGDVVDGLILFGALHRRNPRKGNVLLALAAVAGTLAFDVFCARALDEEENQVLPGPRRGDQGPVPHVPAPPQARRRVSVSPAR